MFSRNVLVTDVGPRQKQRSNSGDKSPLNLAGDCPYLQLRVVSHGMDELAHKSALGRRIDPAVGPARLSCGSRNRESHPQHHSRPTDLG